MFSTKPYTSRENNLMNELQTLKEQNTSLKEQLDYIVRSKDQQIQELSQYLADQKKHKPNFNNFPALEVHQSQSATKLNTEDLDFLVSSISQQQRILQERINEKQIERDQAREEYLTIKTILKDSCKNLSTQQLTEIGQKLTERGNQVDQINQNISNLLIQRSDFDFRIQDIEQKIHKQERLLNQVSDDTEGDEQQDSINNKISEMNQNLEDLYGQKEEIEDLLAESVKQLEQLQQEIQTLTAERDAMKFTTQQRTQQTISSNESYPPNFFKTIEKHEDHESIKDRFKELSGLLILYDSQLNLLMSKQQENQVRKAELISSNPANGNRSHINLNQSLKRIDDAIHSEFGISTLSKLLSHEEDKQHFPSIDQFFNKIADQLERFNSQSSKKAPLDSLLLELSVFNEQLQGMLNQLKTKKQGRSPNENVQRNPIEYCLDLVVNLSKTFKKREKRIQTFQDQRKRFLDEFEIEAQELSQRWRDFENERLQMRNEREDFEKEIEREMNRIDTEKQELKRQQQQVEHIIKKANNEYESIMTQSQMSKSNIEMGISLLNDEKRQLNDQIQSMKSKVLQYQKDINGLNENLRRLSEEEDIQKKRISDQYRQSEKIGEDHNCMLSEIQEMQDEKHFVQQEIDKAQKQREQGLHQMNEIEDKIISESQKLVRLEQNVEMLQQQCQKFESKCREAEGYLFQVNQEKRQREQELSQYDKILGEAKKEKESLKQLRSDNQRLSKENNLLKRDYEEQARTLNQAQLQLYQNKANLDQLMKIIQQKEQELIQLENSLAQQEKALQKAKEENLKVMNETDNARKETKKQQLELNKMKNHLEEMQLDCQASQQEHNVQSQTLKALHKQIEKKVSELSSITQQCQQMTEENQMKIFDTQQELQQLEHECESKHFEYKQIVDQIDQLLQERDTLSSEVDRLGEMERQLQAFAEQNDDQFKALSEKQSQLQSIIKQLSKKEQQLVLLIKYIKHHHVNTLKESERDLSQHVMEQEQYLGQLQKQVEMARQRMNQLQIKEDTFYVMEALNGKEVDGYGQDRIQYLVQCQNSLQEMEKVLIEYKNELDFVRDQRDKLAKTLLNHNIDFGDEESLSVGEDEENLVQERKPQYLFREEISSVHKASQPQKSDQAGQIGSEVEQVLLNLDELNQNIDKMYQESFSNVNDTE